MIYNLLVDYDEDFEEFLDWYAKLNPNEAVNRLEAQQIFFNLEDHEILGV